MDKADKDRCCLCGKLLEAASSVARIEIGSRKGGKASGFKASKHWGDCHEACLNRALPTTRAALSELQRLAKSAVKSASESASTAKNGNGTPAKKKKKRVARATATA